MKTILVITSLLFLCSTALGQAIEDLDVDYKLRGRIFASSSIEDSTALGGFGKSSNFPKEIHDSLQFTETGLFLKIDTSRILTVKGNW